MKKFKRTRKVLALLLSLSLITGMMPASALSAFAASNNEPVYILAGGDFQEAGNHANSAKNVTDILSKVSSEYDTMDGFLFIGDYDCETHDNATETANGITALMDAVQETYTNLNDDNSVLVQGNHDYMDARIDATGGHDFDGYSVYVLNEDDYPNGGGSQSGIQTLANNLETWLNNKLGEGYDAPIFITSHLPLAFSPRTVTQGDAKYAKLVFDVLNTAADNGLNIIFMHGHDHAYGPDNYLGGEAIYLPEGDKIAIAELGSTSAFTTETLNFTYMNAGYTGYYSDPYTYVTNAGTDKLTMTVFKIDNNQVTVERYSANGKYNLKSAGYDGSYSNTSVTNQSLGLGVNSTVYASPQTISLGNVEDYGTIGEYVGVAPDVTDDVTPSGGIWKQIIAPIPGTDATPGTTTYKYVLDTDGVNTNTKYLIANTSSNGNGYVLTNDNGTVKRTQVSVSNGEIIVDDETNVNWIFSGSESGTVVNQNRYVYPNNGRLSLQTSGSNMTISSEDNGEYLIYRTDSSHRKYYLRYNNGWTGTRVNSFSNTTYPVYLFAYDSTITTPGTEATPGTNGTYGKIVGDLTYNASKGMTADEAMALVKAGIDGYYYDAMSTPGSNVTGTKVDDGVLKWEWVDTYNPNVPGDYAVRVSYVHNGTEIELGIAEVVVPATKTYYIAEGNGMYYVNMNTTADNALAMVKAGVTVYSAADETGTNKQVIDDSTVTWKWIDKYDGTDSGPYTVEILYNGTSLGTVEVKVNIKYETGIVDGWTHIGQTEATGGTHTYTLDTDGIEYGEENKYIIVDDNEAVVLNANSTANGTAHTITINGNTATVDTRDYEYHMIRTSYNGTRYELITKGDGSQYLYQEANGVRYGTRSSVKFQVNHHGNGIYNIHDIDGTNWYIIYNGGWTVTETTSARVRLYKYTGTTGGTPAGNLYAKIEGDTTYTVEQGTSASQALGKVKAGITGYVSSSVDGSNPTEINDGDLKWTWKNTYTSMVTGSYWVEISYNGVVLGTVEVKVKPGVIKNYPEYPDEGAVKVSKTATGIDFQSSGIAQVEVSTSGVPVKKGADVIVMLDTSSSMTSHKVTGTSQTRAEVLEESLKNLITQFKTPGDDGELLDLRVAIADFNGFYGENHNASGTPYDRDAADMMSDDISYNANSEAKVYTGDGTLSAGAFIDAEDLAASYTLNYTSGTNYDYAMDAIYQMGTAIKEANGSEERDLYVIFMSDGAAMQWNYYHSQGASSLWNNWICGNWGVEDLSLNCGTHAYYYNDVDTDGDGMMNEHRMANAIKGSQDETYEVIRKTDTLGTPTSEDNMYMVPGLGAKMFSISFDAQTDTNVTEESMDLSIETLASEQTGTTKYYYKVTSAEELRHAFDAIGNEIAYAASNARFVDQMGDDFNLQMTPMTYEVVENGETVSKTLTPKIEIITYDIYTRQDYLNGTITEDKIGDRKGTYTVAETVTFETDEEGNVVGAYSNLIGGGKTNILADGTKSDYVKGVIYAKTFIYNTNVKEVEVTGVNIPTGEKTDGTTTGSTKVLPSETFYWKLGTVQTSELAMRYYVYLEGSMEGMKGAGSYPTNEYATLYYDNYLGNPCYKDTISPTMAWKSANVSYAFYLVNEEGEIIVNQTTGATGSFANKVAVTKPVIYKEILLNNQEQITSLNVKAISDDVLPKYYELYDEAAVYDVTINSNSTGDWKITKGENLVNSTYVTNYKTDDPSAYSNAVTNNTVGNDYTHTTVWFAVVWKVEAHPDAVVVDYGLPVDITVLTNDMFGDYGRLDSIGAYREGLEEITAGNALEENFTLNYTGKYGTAKATPATGKVRYTLNTMEMDGYDKFAYAVNYIGTENAGYYYDTITVIPATNIYYEDDFLTYTASNTEWTEAAADEKVTDVTQDEDRPGKYSLTDANNIYGYDSINKGMSTFSMGSAKKVHVDAGSYAKAKFSFCGTGFDVVGMTSNTTGTIAVKVTDQSGNKVKSTMVNTYYGYTSEEHEILYTYTSGEWVVTDKGLATANTKETAKPESPTEGATYTVIETQWKVAPDVAKSLYQVPVMQIEELPYGKYNVEITATYASAFDQTTADGYDLYLDAIRIYDPANDGASDGSEDATIENAYKADGEGWPSYIELRNKLINPDGDLETEDGTFGNSTTATKVEGLVFIDGDASVGNAQLSDYKSYGPNNEVYLAPGQRVAFILDTPEVVENVHIGIKGTDGNAGTYTITNIAKADLDDGKIKAGDWYNARTFTMDTATEMYYDLTDWKDNIIVISNTGDRYNTTGAISLTNIKSTYKMDPNAGGAPSTSGPSKAVPATTMETSIYMTPAAAKLTLKSLNTPVVPEQPETPDTPVVPDTPVTPEQPDTPVVPEQPEDDKPDGDEPKPERPVADPAKIISVKTDKKTYTQGDNVKVTVTTNKAATKVKIGTKTLKTFKTTKGNKTWTTTVKASKIGKLSISTVAYNKEGTATKKVTKKVTVKQFAPKKFNVTLSKSKVKKGAKYTVTVKTSTSVKYVKVNGKKITKFTTDKKKTTRTFKITYKAANVGKKTVKVVSYNKAGYASKAKSKTVTVKRR